MFFSPSESHQLTLNPNLCLSEGNRVVTFTCTLQQYPDHPDRFDRCFQVLCKECVQTLVLGG